MVIISNGFHKFHMATAAAEANRRNLLASFLTGAYPTPIVRKILSLPFLRTSAKAARLNARREDIPDKAVHALLCSEAVYVTEEMRNLQQESVTSMQLYGWFAAAHVERAAARGARIYHYRAGFGGKSIDAAKKRGLFLVCDHSIAHPAVLEPMIRNMGQMPTRDEMATVSPFWGYVQRDIELADAVVVNSRWVADTFEYFGHRRSPVHVVYLGIDDAFLSQVPPREERSNELRILFAGKFEKRKGAETLIGALEQSSRWRIDVAGPISAELREPSIGFFSNPRVNYLGPLSRRDLAAAMTEADVFLFPSFAEGSARVIFEALACGCYVITTPNSGSIVEDGVHGALVPPGDIPRLLEAIEYAMGHRDRVSEIGRHNARLIRDRYRQCNYGHQLAALYMGLLGERVRFASGSLDPLGG